jgi:hypothetical protein
MLFTLSSSIIYMLAWFLLRRILTALNLVELRDQSIWLQLTFNMWLSLTDVCIKVNLSPYRKLYCRLHGEIQ